MKRKKFFPNFIVFFIDLFYFIFKIETSFTKVVEKIDTKVSDGFHFNYSNYKGILSKLTRLYVLLQTIRMLGLVSYEEDIMRAEIDSLWRPRDERKHL